MYLLIYILILQNNINLLMKTRSKTSRLTVMNCHVKEINIFGSRAYCGDPGKGQNCFLVQEYLLNDIDISIQ